MEIKLFKPLLIALGLIILVIPSATTGQVESIIYVPDNYLTIQSAIDSANPGDTIIVRDGIYTENVKLNKPHLTIKSENGAEGTIVQAADSNSNIFEIAENYVTIEGFTIKGGKSGVYIGKLDNINRIADYSTISNNNRIICDSIDII